MDERLNLEFHDALNSSLNEHRGVIHRLRSVSQDQTVRARARALARSGTPKELGHARKATL